MSERILLSEHARAQLVRRGIDDAVVLGVASQPEVVVPIRLGREVRQGVVIFPPDNKPYIVRVVIDTTPGVATVVTAYRTSKTTKYRSH